MRRFWLAAALLAVLLTPEARAQEAGVSGVVLAGPDQPLAGATVELAPVPSLYEAGRTRIETGGNPKPAASVTTGADGRFRLTPPGQGYWKVVVRVAGRVPVQYPLLWVEPGIELSPVTPPKDAGVPVKVLDAAGQPVPDAWVLATDPEEAAAARRLGIWKVEPRAVRTGPDGTTTLPAIAGRPLEVHILAPGRSEEIRQNFPGGTVALPESASKSTLLKVENPAGAPAAGVQARIGLINWPFGQTDARGEIRLPAGDKVPRLRLVTSDGRQKVMRPVDRSETLRVSLNEPRVLTGRVVDTQGKALKGALLSPDADPGAVLKTDEEGRYRLALPGAGPLSLEVRAAGYLPKRLGISAADLQAGRIPAVSLERAISVPGIALDAARRPLPGVTIEAVPSGVLGSRQLTPREPVVDRVTTDASGRFTLRRLRGTETYEIRARKTGLFTAAQLVAVPAGGLSEKKRVELRLLPVRAARGRIVDPQGKAIPGARVMLRPTARLGFPVIDPRAEPELAEDDPAAAESDASGGFQIAACPAEEMDVEVIKPGFARAFRRGVKVTDGKAVAVNAVDLGTITLTPGARLAGRVIDSKSKPIAGAEVFLLAAPPRGFDPEDSLRDRKPTATSDADGRFEVPDLSPSVPQYLVTRAEGYLISVLSGVRPPQPKPVVIRLQKGATLSGRVVDESGKGIEEARVDLTWQAMLTDIAKPRPVGKPISRSATTDADGRFQLRNSPEGPVTLDVEAQGYIPVSEFAAMVPWPDPRQELVFVLKKGATLSGRVTTTAGEPVERARVSAQGGGGWTDADGAYRIEGIQEGVQEVRLFHPDYPRQERQIKVEPGDNVQDFTFEAGTEVSGRALDETGKPVAGAQVTLRSAERWDPRQFEAVSGEDGRFSMRPVTAGSFKVHAEAGELKSRADATITVAKEPVTGIDVVLRAGAVLTGKVLGLSPEELAKVEVQARREDGRTFPARVQADGTYEVRALEPGDWVVQASLWQGQRQTQERVPIAPDDREVTRDLDFGHRATLSGRVLYNDEPLADAVLSVRGQRLVRERTVRTDFEGAFRIDDLEADRYWLGISHPDRWVTHNQWLDLQGDQDVEIRLEGATLSGRVQEEGSGKPVAAARIILRPTTGPEFMFASATEEDGSFQMARVPAATLRMQVSANGYETVEREIQVGGGQTLSGLEITLKPAQGLRLQVRKASGGTPAFVHLFAQAPDGRILAQDSRPPDANGIVELSSLPPGQWTLLIGGTGAATIPQTVAVPGPPVQVTLPDAATLQVRVADLASSDVAATMTLMGADQKPFKTLVPGGRLQQSWPLTGGRGTVEGVPAGTWTLKIEASDGRVWTATVTSAGMGEMRVSVP